MGFLLGRRGRDGFDLSDYLSFGFLGLGVSLMLGPVLCRKSCQGFAPSTLAAS